MTRNAMMMLAIVMIGVSLLTGSDLDAQENKLVIWSHWKDEPVKINSLTAIAEEFTKIHQIPVEFVWLPKTELLEKLPFALDSTEPDLMYLDATFTQPRIWRSLVDLGDLALTVPIDTSWAFADLGDTPNAFLPFEGISNGIYYNIDLFKQAHIQLPQDRPLTSTEFLDVIRALRAAGITPIGEGSSDRPTKIGLPLINTIFRYAGPEKVERLIHGELKFSDPDVAAGLQFWKQVVDAGGYDAKRATQLSFLDGIFEVVDGKAAMNFCGTFFYGKYGTTDRDKGQIGVLDWFTVENGNGNNYYEVTWAAGYGINKHSAHLDAAQKFLTFMMTPTAASLWVKHVQTPYPVQASEIIPDSLYGMLTAQRTGQQTSPTPFSYVPFPSKAQQQMWEMGTRKFITGEHSVEQFIERMESRSE